MRYVLTILTRYPAPGRSKTRLAIGTSPAVAAAIHAGMLLDTIDHFVRVPSMTVVILFPYYEPEHVSGLFYALLLKHHIPIHNVLTMAGIGSMNDDIAYAHTEVLARFPRSFVCGADMPHYQPDQYFEMVRELERADVVYHPCEDDGCCPHGVKKPFDLWKGLDSRQGGYISQFEQRCALMGLVTAQLSRMFDVDTLDDLYRLMREFGDQCPHTMRAIEQSLPTIQRQMLI